MPVGASDDPRHILFNPYHYSHTAYRGTHAHCRQRCLRRLCKYLMINVLIIFYNLVKNTIIIL